MNADKVSLYLPLNAQPLARTVFGQADRSDAIEAAARGVECQEKRPDDLRPASHSAIHRLAHQPGRVGRLDRQDRERRLWLLLGPGKSSVSPRLVKS